MPVLVIADHDGALIKDATLNTVTAANEIDTDVHLLVAGSDCRGAADAAAKWIRRRVAIEIARVASSCQVDSCPIRGRS